MDLITASIPFFFGLIGLELLVARLRKRPLYRLSDSISDLSCGILSQLAGIFFTLVTITSFGWIGAHWTIQQLGAAPAWPKVVGNWNPAGSWMPGGGWKPGPPGRPRPGPRARSVAVAGEAVGSAPLLLRAAPDDGSGARHDRSLVAAHGAF